MQMERFWKLRSSAILEEEKHHLVHFSRESEIEKAWLSEIKCEKEKLAFWGNKFKAGLLKLQLS